MSTCKHDKFLNQGMLVCQSKAGGANISCTVMLRSATYSPAVYGDDRQRFAVFGDVEGSDAAAADCARHIESQLGGCGLQHDGSTSKYHGILDGVFVPQEGYEDRFGSVRHRSISFMVFCQLTEPLPHSVSIHAVDLTAYLDVRCHSLPRPCKLEVPIQVASPPSQCNVRMCTKVWGNGGLLGTPGYARFYAERMRAAGVREVALYALEPLPHALKHVLKDPVVMSVVRLIQWQTAPFSRNESVPYLSVQGGREHGPMYHCVHDAKAFDWVMVLDGDEHLVVARNTSNGTVTICDALLNHAVHGAFHLQAIRHEKDGTWDLGRDANRPVDEQWRMAEAGAQNSSAPDLGWKSIFQPVVSNRGSEVDMHGWNSYERKMALVPPGIAYIRHFHGYA